MSLSDLVLPEKRIQVGTGDFVVHGVSLTDVSLLIREHKDDLERLVNLYEHTAESGVDPLEDNAAGMSFIQTLVTELPGLVAKTVACASGEPKAWEKALALPFPTQVDALMAIGQLTFEDPEGVKKFMENVVQMIAVVRGQVEDLTPSQG